jgi:hypothetical protein
MKSAITAVYWEILYKNRLVFAVLGELCWSWRG